MTAGAVVGVMALAGAGPAAALPADQSEGLGKFLGGSVVGGVDLDTLAAVAGADAAYTSGPASDQNPLSAAVLSSLGVTVPGGIQLLGANGLIQLGAVNQTAAVTASTAMAASGAVTDQGAIVVGGNAAAPSNATVDLKPLLAGTPVDAVASGLAINLGALSATANDTVGTAPVGTYQIANANVVLTSPAVAGLSAATTTAIAPSVNTAINGLVGPTGLIAGTLSGGLLGPVLTALGVQPTVALSNFDLNTALAPVFQQTFGTDGVVLDPANGTVTVDLNRILTDSHGWGLNNAPVNTQVMDAATINQILAGLNEALTDLTTAVVNAVDAALRAATLTVAVNADLGLPVADTSVGVNISGTVQQFLDGTATGTVAAQLLGVPVAGLNLAALLGPIGTVLNNVLFSPTGLVAGLANTVTTQVAQPLVTALTPVFQALTTVASLIINVQQSPGDLPNQSSTSTPSFTQRALSLSLANLLSPGAGLATVNLASATVRLLDVAITATPSTVPASGTTTITGSGFTPNSTVTVQLTTDGTTPSGAAVTTTSDANGNISVPLPVAASTPPGGYTVVATDSAGLTASTPLTVTAAPTLAPDRPTVPAGGTVTVTGTGYTPNGQVTVTTTPPGGGTPTTQTVTADGSGDITFPFATTPGQTLGAYGFTAVDQTTSASASTTVTVTAAPTVNAPPVADAGTTVTIPGTGFTPGQPVHVVVTDPANGTVLDGTVTPDSSGNISVPVPLPAGATPGTYTVTATDTSGAAATDTFAVVNPAIDAPASTTPGQTVTVTGTGYLPGEPVTFTLTDPSDAAVGTPVTVTAGADGSVTASVPVPSGSAPGVYTVTGTGQTSGAAATDTIAVVDPALTASTPTVAQGGTATITGSGFTPNGAVTLTVVDGGGNTTTVPLTADADGAVTYPFATTTATPLGATTFTAVDVATGQTSAPVTVQVIPPQPTIAAPATAQPGDTITVTGTDYLPGSTVTVTITDAGGNPVATVTTTADASGAISTPVTIPAGTPAGPLTVTGVDPTNRPATAPVTLIDPALAASPATVPAGGTSTVTGTGFTPSSTITVTITAPDSTTSTTTVTTDAAGSFTLPFPTSSSTALGDYTFSAPDPSGATATTTVTVTPAPTLTPEQPQVPSGGATTVDGSGFTPGGDVTVTVTMPDGSTDTQTVTADGNGDIQVVVITSPTDPAGGVYDVTATDPSGAQATTTVTTTGPPTVDAPSTFDGGAGGDMPASGDGYTPDSTVTVVLLDPDGNPVGDPVQVTTDGDGHFTTTIPVPPGSPAGQYTVVATDDATGALGDATVGVTDPAPTAPATRALTSTFTEPVVHVGDLETYNASGFRPGELVRAVIHSVPLQLAPTAADVNGVAHWTFTVPADFELGTHTGTATSVSVGDSTSSTFQVVSAATATVADPGPLPRTGSDVVGVTLLAGLLMLAGGAAVALTRRRRA